MRGAPAREASGTHPAAAPSGLRLGAAGVPRQPPCPAGPFHAASPAPAGPARGAEDASLPDPPTLPFPRGLSCTRSRQKTGPRPVQERRAAATPSSASALPPRGRDCGSARRSPPSKRRGSLLRALPALRTRRGRRGRSEPTGFICPRKGGKRQGALGAPASGPHPDSGRARSLRSREPHRGCRRWVKSPRSQPA